MPSVELGVFTIVSLLMVASSCLVVFSRNIIYSAFALLGTLFGTAVVFGILSADFVAVTQLLVYVGGVLILVLFAVMLTQEISDVNITNLSVNYKIAAPVIFLLAIILIATFAQTEWFQAEPVAAASSVRPIGNALLTKYLLPFELISILLLGALVGAVVLVRREVR